MKKLMFMAFLGLLSCNSNAGKNEKNEKDEAKTVQAPAVVAQAFQKDYPNVTKVSWVAEDSAFEAEFKLDGIEASAIYDKMGKRTEVELAVKNDELPANALSYVTKNFSAYKLSEVAKITDANQVVTYEAEITKKDQSSDLIFDAAGNFIKKE